MRGNKEAALRGGGNQGGVSVGPRGCGQADILGLTTDPQARLEVHRFGITGYGKGKERILERERAIMLGAKVSRGLPL